MPHVCFLLKFAPGVVPLSSATSNQHQSSPQLHVLLLPLLQIQPADATQQPAAAAAQQAELVLLKCKAATASAAAQQSGSSRGRPAGSSSSSSLLFELAGVHCCSADSALGKPARKVTRHVFVCR
jgi:hypothetical protein